MSNVAANIKRMSRHTAVYGFGNILNRAITFLLLPLYTNILSTADYGVLNLIYPFLGLMNVVFMYGMDSAFMRFFITEKDEKRRLEIFSTVYISILVTTTVFTGLLYLVEPTLAHAILGNDNNFLYLGRGKGFPIALEGALKLKEISYIHAEGYPAAEMKHGPIALIDENMPVVFLATKSTLSKKLLGNIEEVKARKGLIIVIANENNEAIKKFADYLIEVPETMEELSPLINVVALQLLAYYIADMRGLDVDKPRNLAKSVTVE